MGGLLLAQAGKADPVTARVYVFFCNRLYIFLYETSSTVQSVQAALQANPRLHCLIPAYKMLYMDRPTELLYYEHGPNSLPTPPRG